MTLLLPEQPWHLYNQINFFQNIVLLFFLLCLTRSCTYISITTSRLGVDPFPKILQLLQHFRGSNTITMTI